jgi:hypothetical protein
MDPNGFYEWIYDRCCHDGKLTQQKSEFSHMFPEEGRSELENLTEFCESKRLTFTVDKEHQTFTFDLPDP